MVMVGSDRQRRARPTNTWWIEPRAGSRMAGLADVEKFYVDFLHALPGCAERRGTPLGEPAIRGGSCRDLLQHTSTTRSQRRDETEAPDVTAPVRAKDRPGATRGPVQASS